MSQFIPVNIIQRNFVTEKDEIKQAFVNKNQIAFLYGTKDKESGKLRTDIHFGGSEDNFLKADESIQSLSSRLNGDSNVPSWKHLDKALEDGKTPMPKEEPEVSGPR